ncbi:MAG: hypothetical protein JWO48_1952 [Bryobacterales bacterium]|nr:hypothetical protein [Bryobacterales bacterium]
MGSRNRVAATVLVLVVSTGLTARASEATRQTPFSTNEPLEVPGRILEPGSYVLKLVEPEPQRNVLQVFETVQLWTGDEQHLLSTLLTMPNYDVPTTDKTVFAFFERGPKQPKALRIWFSPGRNYGEEFVYPRGQAVELAKSIGRGVLSLPAELPADVGQLNRPTAEYLKSPPAPVPAPRTEPATSNRAISPPAANTAPLQAAPVQSRARARNGKMIATSLPKTGSYLPLLATLGLLGIVAGGLLRMLAVRLERH